MKRLIALLLACVIVFTGCSANTASQKSLTEEIDINNSNSAKVTAELQDLIYTSLIDKLNNKDFYVENIKATYISKEYIEEMEYNSKSNIYFGYTLAELDECFNGKRYVFTLDDNGKTIVQEFEKYEDSFSPIIKNLAIGTGVILFSVTISAVSGALGGGAISLLFASMAHGATVRALQESIAGSIVGFIDGIQTGDVGTALEKAVLVGSESFKWGAYFGTIEGAFKGAAQLKALKGATLNGLTLNQAAKIQKETKWPNEIIKKLHSIDEYNVLKDSNLKLYDIDGTKVLSPDIDWDFVGDIKDGRTNAERLKDGLSPLGKDGKAYEGHHIGQANDSPIAILTYDQHKNNYSILHKNTGATNSEVDHTYAWSKQKHKIYEGLCNAQKGNG